MFGVLPTLLTLGNAVCGFGAVTFAGGWTKYEPATAFFLAGLLIFLAMVFDGLDGAAARWTGRESEFGARLDSLCDAVSFGVAPAVLVIWLGQPFGYHPRVVWVAAAVYLACTLLRLARFGLEAPDDPQPEPGLFWGLPSPAAAAVVASWPVMLYGPQVLADDTAGPAWDVWAARLLPVVAVALAGLMVSRVRYRHLVRDLRRRRGARRRVVGLIFAAAVAAAVPRVVVPLAVCWYAFAPPLAAGWDRGRRGRTPADGPVRVTDGT